MPTDIGSAGEKFYNLGDLTFDKLLSKRLATDVKYCYTRIHLSYDCDVWIETQLRNTFSGLRDG